MIGIITGSAFRTTGLLDGLHERTVETQYGPVAVHTGGDLIVVARHSPALSTPPHRINHQANLAALAELGAGTIIGANSTGSLKEAITPGSIVIPHDYLCPWLIATYCEEKVRHVTPALDADLREVLAGAARETGIEPIDEAVYAQTIGPRYETPAEVRLLASCADIVGMTMANEADCAAELGLRYASVCAVDNWANGIGPAALDHDDLLARQAETIPAIEKLLRNALGRLAD